MGTCFSATTASRTDQPMITAIVIGADGSLTEYSEPINAARVLGPNYLSTFLCNSDSLCYESYISALRPAEFIELGQLYFVLPNDKLRSALSGPDMAALAVKASCALANFNVQNRRGRGTSSTIRVVPLSEVDDDYSEHNMRSNEDSVGMRNSSSTKAVGNKMQKTNRLSSLHRQKLSAIKE